MDNVKFLYPSVFVFVFAADVTFSVFAVLQDYYKDLERKQVVIDQLKEIRNNGLKRVRVCIGVRGRVS